MPKWTFSGTVKVKGFIFMTFLSYENESSTLFDPVLADRGQGGVFVHVVANHQGLVAVFHLEGIFQSRCIHIQAHGLLGQADGKRVLGGDGPGDLHGGGQQIGTFLHNELCL